MDNSTQTLLVVFIAIAAISILMQAGFTVAIFLGARKAQKKITTLADDVRLHALPAIMSSRELIQDLTPKLKSITENLTATTATLRSKRSKSGYGGRRNRESARPGFAVDGIVKGTLDQLTLAVQAIEHGIAVPVRQVNGIINGLRAGVDVMRSKDAGNHLDSEDDLFV